MNRPFVVTVKGYGEDAPEQEVHLGALARSLSIEQLAELLGDFVNTGGKGFRTGQDLGREMTNQHRTLQRLLVLLALGILAGFGETDLSIGTDPRNHDAIKTAQKVRAMIEDGDLGCGFLV